MKYRWCAFLFVFFTLFADAQSVAFYVAPQGSDAAAGTAAAAPLHTIAAAQSKVRAYRMAHPADSIYVYFMAGEYPLTSPVRFDPNDGGNGLAPVIYSAFGGQKVTWNGGIKITGWKKYDSRVWVAPVNHLTAGSGAFAQLYVNGSYRRRARLPDTGFFHVQGFPDGGLGAGYQTASRRFEYKPGDIQPNWKNKSDLEVVVYHFWTDTHLKVDSVNDARNILTFKYPSGKVFTDDFNSDGARYIVENVWEGMKQLGDWYLDKQAGNLYYLPLPGEDMHSAEVYAPLTPAFIHIMGNALEGKPVTNLHFDGITFQYANIQLPEGDVNNAQGASTLPAAITLNGAQNCSFTNCAVSNIGGYAVELAAGCVGNRFSYNRFQNLAGGGFRVSGAAPPHHPLLQTHSNIFSDNDVGPYGLQYRSAIGIFLLQTYNNVVVHNHVHDGFYTGVSVGWEWGYQRSISRDNIISYNHIHHIGQGLLSDMGAVYTLGVSPGTVVRNNLIHDVDAHNYGGWGIYNDEGSTGILVENNVVYNTKFAGYNIHYAKEITVRNNIFALGRLQQLNRTRVDPHTSVFFENNIVYWKEGVLFDGDWKDKPYRFYFNPMDDNGSRLVESTFEADYNIYYNPLVQVDSVLFNSFSWNQWQANGKDVHSLYADPLFVAPEQYNFNLLPQSPAFKTGFRPIDITGVGVRPRP